LVPWTYTCLYCKKKIVEYGDTRGSKVKYAVCRECTKAAVKEMGIGHEVMWRINSARKVRASYKQFLMRRTTR